MLPTDVRYAFRVLRKSPVASTAAFLTLALGIGANTAIFSVAEALLLRPLPYGSPDRLVVALHDGTFPVSPADYLDWRKQARSFDAMEAAQSWSGNLDGGDRPESVPGLQVSPNLFAMLGVAPALGRPFAEGDGQPGRNRLLILSHSLWMRRFGGSLAAVGSRVLVDGESFEIAGVMPKSFEFPPFWATGAEMWTPLALSPRLNDRAGRSLRVFARLKPGVERSQAQSELDAICAGLELLYPRTNTRLRASVVPLQEKVVGDMRDTVVALAATAGMMLLITCVNLAALSLARASARQREIAVRAAIGAGRAQLMRPILVESLLLSLAGGSTGLLLARWGIAMLLATLPPAAIPRSSEITVNVVALLFGLACSVITGVLSGLAPAWRASLANSADALRERGRSFTASRKQSRLRGLLVSIEVALALALLSGAGLLVKSFARLQSVDPGFDPHNVLSFVVSTGGTSNAGVARRAPFYRAVLERLASIPGVAAAGAINHLPLAGDRWTMGIAVEGRPEPAPGQVPGAVYRVVSPGYFGAMRIHLRGRDFTRGDHATAPDAVIINDALARRHWPGEDPVGRRISLDLRGNQRWLTIVGVASDVRQGEWTREAASEIYLPFEQRQDLPSYFTFVVRGKLETAGLVAAIRDQVGDLDRAAPLSRVITMPDVISRHLWRARVSMALVVLFALLAVVLAACGLYGVLAQTVEQRRHEIGVRVALGAGRADVLRLVLSQGAIYVGAGIVCGLALAVASGRLMTTLLYKVAPNDPAIYTLTAAAIALVAAIAHWAPARGALNVDPAKALRSE